jgi:hypothetical protein
MDKFISFFKNKGIVCTILGIAFGAPINIKIILNFYKQIEMSNQTLLAAVALNIIAWGWVMMPSVILIKSKLLEFRIED